MNEDCKSILYTRKDMSRILNKKTLEPIIAYLGLEPICRQKHPKSHLMSDFYSESQMLQIKNVIESHPKDLKGFLAKNSLVRHYGENYNDIINNKIKETKLERYGKDYNSAFNDRIKKTKLERYGNENYNNSDKIKITQSKKSKEDFEELRKKQLSTTIERLGNNYREILIERCKASKLKNHGNENYNNREKTRQTCLEKYGKEYYAQTETFKSECKNSWKLKIEKFEKENNCTHIGNLNTKTYHDRQTIELVLNRLGSNFIRDRESNKYIDNRYKDALIKELNLVKDSSKSESEKDIASFIRDIYSGSIIENDRTLLNGKELDIYIPEKKVAIEFDGLYWHCEEFKSPTYHLEKTIACEHKGIRLIHIFEDEWINKRPIVESVIASSLGVYHQKLYARNCEVRTVDINNASVFLSNNHLQGEIKGKNLGLYYKNELVQLVTYGKSRFKKGEIELYRMCTKLNTQVIGGFSKLLSHIDEAILISYIDRRLFDGKGYISTKWEKIGYSKPSYFYIVKGKRENRLNWQKKFLKDRLSIYNENRSEHQNMLNNDYYRIYDCGTIKVKYIKEN